MGYVTGAVKYMVKSAFKNTYAMAVFGAATLAILYMLDEAVRGRPTAALIDYIVTKYLPPLTAEGFVMIVVVGCVWAGVKWYWKTPRR